MAQCSGGHAALFQDPSSVSSIHGGQLTTPCISRSNRYNASEGTGLTRMNSLAHTHTPDF